MPGITQEGNETAEDVVDKVHNVIKDINCDVFLDLIDIELIHRVGKKREDIIVKKISFRDRTVVYKARKKCKDTQNHKDVRIGLDLAEKKGRGRMVCIKFSPSRKCARCNRYVY